MKNPEQKNVDRKIKKEMVFFIFLFTFFCSGLSTRLAQV